MVSDQYRVNVAMSSNGNEMAAEKSNEKLRDIKGSISSPIPNEDVTSVLEYFGITPSEKKMEHPHNRLVNNIKKYRQRVNKTDLIREQGPPARPLTNKNSIKLCSTGRT